MANPHYKAGKSERDESSPEGIQCDPFGSTPPSPGGVL